MVAPVLCAATVFSTAAGSSSRLIFFSCACRGETSASPVMMDVIVKPSKNFMGLLLEPEFALHCQGTRATSESITCKELPDSCLRITSLKGEKRGTKL